MPGVKGIYKNENHFHFKLISTGYSGIVGIT